MPGAGRRHLCPSVQEPGTLGCLWPPACLHSWVTRISVALGSEKEAEAGTLHLVTVWPGSLGTACCVCPSVCPSISSYTCPVLSPCPSGDHASLCPTVWPAGCLLASLPLPNLFLFSVSVSVSLLLTFLVSRPPGGPLTPFLSLCSLPSPSLFSTYF